MIGAANLTVAVNKHSRIVNGGAAPFSESEAEAGLELFGKPTESVDIRPANRFCDVKHRRWCGSAFDDIHDDVAFQYPLSRQNQLWCVFGSLDEESLQFISVGGFIPFGRF